MTLAEHSGPKARSEVLPSTGHLGPCGPTDLEDSRRTPKEFHLLFSDLHELPREAREAKVQRCGRFTTEAGAWLEVQAFEAAQEPAATLGLPENVPTHAKRLGNRHDNGEESETRRGVKGARVFNHRPAWQVGNCSFAGHPNLSVRKVASSLLRTKTNQSRSAKSPSNSCLNATECGLDVRGLTPMLSKPHLWGEPGNFLFI